MTTSRLAGYHLMIDGQGRRPDIWIPFDVDRLLLDIVDAAEMKLIAGPTVQENGAGIMGIAVLAESHTSVHLDRESGIAFVDLFSCKGFDEGRVISLVSDRLDLDRHAEHLLCRNFVKGAMLTPRRIPALAVDR